MSKQTIAFKMKLKEGCKDAYIKRHEAIWPELKEVLLNAGISDYHIFLDEATNTLFAIQKVSGDNYSQNLGSNHIVKKWWSYMEPLMETNPDKSPVAIPLDEVFHLA